MKRTNLTKVVVLIVITVLIAGLAFSCIDPQDWGTIEIRATFDGSPWVGDVEYRLVSDIVLQSPGDKVPVTRKDHPAQWTLEYISGGPPGACLFEITPSPVQNLDIQGHIVFTLNFKSRTAVDASIKHLGWTRNGDLTPGGGYEPYHRHWHYDHGPGESLGTKYRVSVNSSEPELVLVKARLWFRFMNKGRELVQEIGPSPYGDPLVTLVYNDDSAAVHTDGARLVELKSYIWASSTNWKESPVSNGDRLETNFPPAENVRLILDLTLELEPNRDYDIAVNWLGWPDWSHLFEDWNPPVPARDPALWELQGTTYPAGLLKADMSSYPSVSVVNECLEDTDQSNNQSYDLGMVEKWYLLPWSHSEPPWFPGPIPQPLLLEFEVGNFHVVATGNPGSTYAWGMNLFEQCNVGNWTDIVQVAAGDWHSLGLKSDGTVLAVGSNLFGECDVGGWTDIVQVAGGGSHTVGLRSDGTAVAVGRNLFAQCNVGGWTDVVQVAGGDSHTVGLRSNGTVLAIGDNHQSQCDVSSWTDIVQVAAGVYHTAGLMSDGTVVAVGWDDYGQCDVGSWTDIVQVSAGLGQTIGLRVDGTVVAVGANTLGQCDVGSWTDIVQVAAGEYFTAGLESDGTVVFTGGPVPPMLHVSFYTEPSATGSINFDGSVYYDEDSTTVVEGFSYSIQANVPGGFSFAEWRFGGGVFVMDPYDASTVCQVTDDGWLEMVMVVDG